MRLHQFKDSFKILHHNGNNGEILLIAGHHGNEPIGWEMLHHVIKQLDDVSVPLDIIPFACPEGAKLGTRNFLGKDPNRVYKNYVNGTHWSKRIVDNLIGKKLVFDFHGADADPKYKKPFIYCSNIDKWSDKFNKFDIEQSIPPEGSFRWIANELGIDCITLEGLSCNKSDSFKLANVVVGILKNYSNV